MAREISHWFDSVMRQMGGEIPRQCWAPAADLYRTRDGWLLKFDVAGVHPTDIHVTLSGARLTVSGRRRDQFVEEGVAHYRMEISYSSFERTVELPDDVEQPDIETRMEEGMLLVRIRRKGDTSTSEQDDSRTEQSE